MATAQRAYRYNYDYDYNTFEPEHSRRPDVRVVPGSRTSLSPSITTAAKLAAIVMVVIACVCFVRLSLSSATVATMMDSSTLQTQISQARSEGTSLEMQQTQLTSPTALKAAADEYGMSAPSSVSSINLGPDVVAEDADGNLSLSQTVANVASSQE